ncbi:DUF7601 domain-containing protein [Faecalibacterium prausnitzii]|uniref:DUF7601 domain-containing protein n=1 Tax=Faecalibacterium prausnitzii TaxID=853 RepID=UPI0012DC767B|nr:hypothetical protein [Faecalibacterium prausnitzii]
MKLKKFFAGVLAAAMMLTVGATAAFAEETGNNGKVTNSFEKDNITLSDTLTLTKHYDVIKGKAPLEDFTFNIEYVGSKNVETGVTYTPPTFTPKQAKFGADVDNKATASGLPVGNYTSNFTIAMSELGLGNVNGTGIFVYRITEVIAGTPGVAYNTDNGALYMIVTVTHQTEGDSHNIIKGRYNYAVALRRAGADAGTDQALAGTKVSAAEAFHNTYGADNIVNGVELSKTVHGNFADLGKKFTFSVKFDKATASSAKVYGPITVDNTTGNAIYEADDNGNATGNAVTELEYGKTYIVTLKHEDKVAFNNLPAGVTYTMTENGKSTTESGAVKVDGVYDVTGEQSEAKTIQAGANVDKVEIHNTNQESPDMGVVLDNAPYIAMLAIVAIGGVALMLNKRRRDEE